jgi:CH-like domain in sperm protein
MLAGLSTAGCPSVMQVLASGYVLGEVLAKLNMQPDFDEFEHAETPNAMLNNFMRLLPTLKSLGVKLDSHVANAIICQEHGVASALLYNIRRVWSVCLPLPGARCCTLSARTPEMFCVRCCSRALRRLANAWTRCRLWQSTRSAVGPARNQAS